MENKPISGGGSNPSVLGDTDKVVTYEESGASGDSTEVLSSRTDDSTGSQGDEYGQGLILIVGPEVLTKKVHTAFEAVNEGGVRIKMTPQLKAENAGRWKNEDVAYIVFVIDSSDPIGLKRVDDQLSYLDRNYVFPFDRINFLLVQDPMEGKVMMIKASDVASFMAKFGQPLINIIFNSEWETDTAFHEQMRMFINRFQSLIIGDPADVTNNSNNNSPRNRQ